MHLTKKNKEAIPDCNTSGCLHKIKGKCYLPKDVPDGKFPLDNGYYCKAQAFKPMLTLTEEIPYLTKAILG